MGFPSHGYIKIRAEIAGNGILMAKGEGKEQAINELGKFEKGPLQVEDRAGPCDVL